MKRKIIQYPNMPYRSSRKENEGRIRQLIIDNRALGSFTATLLETVKAVHQIACDGHESLHLTILPRDRRCARRFHQIAAALGPYCVEIKPVSGTEGDSIFRIHKNSAKAPEAKEGPPHEPSAIPGDKSGGPVGGPGYPDQRAGG